MHALRNRLGDTQQIFDSSLWQIEAATLNTLRSQVNGCYTATSTVKKHAFGVCHAHSQFENRLRARKPPGLPLMRCFTGHNHLEMAFEPSYPEGNFEGNQLLGGSIGLSPLCHTQATQFARQNSD
jgi:hypothetical protein